MNDDVMPRTQEVIDSIAARLGPIEFAEVDSRALILYLASALKLSIDMIAERLTIENALNFQAATICIWKELGCTPEDIHSIALATERDNRDEAR